MNPSVGARFRHPTAMDGGSAENAGAFFCHGSRRSPLPIAPPRFASLCHVIASRHAPTVRAHIQRNALINAFANNDYSAEVSRMVEL
ncbi:MAG: hypothetical protein Q7U82_01385 [Gammaproteobacteria bacterium]|nr:hypothetical protein [Gammaproteobacteria bacterium]